MPRSCQSRKDDAVSAAPPTDAPAARPPLAAICVLLAAATLAVYAQVRTHDFITFDDPDYVTENPVVRAGLTRAGIKWAFTTFDQSNWHPLTWLSHMLDVRLFGLDAGAQHLVNVFFHLGATLLLFLAFARMTARPWRSALVAAIFALHPLHVESVAWIAERKDVLSGFFASLALLLYARYADRPSPGRYLGVALSVAAGLMAKPMLVTLPALLLLLDVWPLRRGELDIRDATLRDKTRFWAQLRPLVREKLPLFALAGISALLTVLAHAASGRYFSLTAIPSSARLANAAVSAVKYLGFALWPARLGVFYPWHRLPPWEGPAAAALLGALTWAAGRAADRRPYLLVGWLWYLGMLLPVSGLFQVGSQAMADRFTYLPLVGCSFALVWLVADLVENRGAMRRGACGLALLVLSALVLGAYRQVQYWRDSGALYEHTLAVTTDNAVMLNDLGAFYANQGRYGAAVTQFRAAIALIPDYVDARENLGLALGLMGRLDESIAESAAALRFNPRDFKAEINLCVALRLQGRPEKAETRCRAALLDNPGDARARYNLALALAAGGDKAGAAAELTQLLATHPDYPGARALLGEYRQGGGR